MMDAVVLLTPIFLVGIVALLGFVGGNQIFGFIWIKPNSRSDADD